jgi:hypothetical protein
MDSGSAVNNNLRSNADFGAAGSARSNHSSPIASPFAGAAAHGSKSVLPQGLRCICITACSIVTWPPGQRLTNRADTKWRGLARSCERAAILFQQFS